MHDVNYVVKNTWEFTLAWVISIVFCYCYIKYNVLTYGLRIVYVYLFLLVISLIIFYCIRGYQIFIIPFIPIFPVVFLFFLSLSRKINKYFLKEDINQNTHKKIVVIVTHFSWYNLNFYINNSPTPDDIIAITKYLKNSNKEFSFYLKSSRDDIEKIMRDKKVREVYFLGHGDSDKFQIDANNSAKYIEFNNKKYSKNYVHQIHCGSKKGIPLRYYVVPKKNWKQCYFKRDVIKEKDIVKYFKDKKGIFRKNNL